MKKKMILLLTAVWMVATSLVAQEQQMPPIPMDPAVKVGVLPNGLTYYIRHNEWPEKRVNFYIAQKVGSVQEEENQRGLAHFLEHMCFNGTKHFPGDRLKQYLERIGVKFGENLNAYTAFDETVYNINNVNVETPGAIDSCLLILHDWSHDLLLEDKEIDKERGVINEEWRMRRSPMLRMLEKTYEKMFEGTRYAQRMPIGTMEVVMNFPYEDLRAYYHRWYRPDLQALVIVGDVDVNEIEQKIKTMFADIKAAAPDASKREYYSVPDNEKPLIDIQKDKEQANAYALMMFKMQAVPRQMKSNTQYLVLNFVKQAISNMLNERLAELRKKENAPFSGASISFGEFLSAKTMDAVEASVTLKEGRYMDGMTAVYRELLRAQRGGFTASEYARFQQEYLSQVDAKYNARDKVESDVYVNDYVRHFLDNEPAPGIEWLHQVMNQLVPMIPLDAINQTIAQLPANNRAIALFLPEKEGLSYPTEQQILEAVAAVDAENIEPYKEEINTDPLVPELNSDVAVKKIQDGVYGAKLMTLTNGIRIHILPTNYSPNQISMKATSWGGSSLYPNSEYLCADNVPLVSLGGWGAFSATELNKKLAGIQASATPILGNRTEGLECACVKKDFETMLQLMYLCFTAPRRDDEAYKSTIERVRNALKNADLNPRTALQDSVASVVYNNNVRALRTRAEDLDKFNYDRILEIYRERFANAGDFEFYLVGDVNVDSVAPLLAKYLGALPTEGKKEKYKKVDQVITKGEKTCVFEKVQDTPSSTSLFVYHGKVKYNLRNSILMDMLQQAMQMLFTETVREDEGGAYGVPVGVSLTDYPEQVGVVQVQLPTSPDKRERMTQVIYDGVAKMCAEGPSEDNLKKIKEYMIRSHAENLKDNSYWMNALYMKTRFKYESVKDYDQIVQDITVADVQAVARKVFQSGNRLAVSMTSPASQTAK